MNLPLSYCLHTSSSYFHKTFNYFLIWQWFFLTLWSDKKVGQMLLQFKWIFMSLKGMFALPKRSIDYKSHRLLTISCGIFPLSFQLASQCDVSLNMIIYFSLESCLLFCSRKMILEKKASSTSQCNIYDYLQPIIMNDKRKRIQFPCSSHIKKHWFQFESQPTSIV